MAVISTRYFAYQPDNYLLLSGDEWLRPMADLGDWQHIRLGVLCAVRPNSNVGISESTFTIGLSSGRWNGMSSQVCNNFVGLSLCASPAQGSVHVWNYTNNSGNCYFAPATSGQAFRRFSNPASGSTYVLGAAAVTMSWGIPVAGVGIRKRRIPLIVDIQRSLTTGVYTVTLYNPSDSAADYRADHLLEAMDQPGVPIVAGQTWVSASTTLSAAEDTGTLDTMSVFWSALPVYSPSGMELYAAMANVIDDGGTPQFSYPAVNGAYDLLASSGSTTQTGYGTYGPAWTQVGTGTATGLATGLGWTAPYAFYGTANLAAQSAYVDAQGHLQIGYAGSTMAADDPFAQYGVGTVFSGTLAGGTYWASAWSWLGTVSGTWSNFGSLWDDAAFYGTVFGPNDSFSQYSLGTVLVMNGGTGFAGSFTPVYYAGTTFPMWAAIASLVGASGTFAGTFYLMSTSSGYPYDGFESYASGAISVLTAGTGWASYGTIYAH